jgi:AbrB family looped-hinge helix DNA binding protein
MVRRIFPVREPDMADTARVQTRGRLTLPKEVRLALGVEDGDELVFEATSRGQVVLKAKPRKAALVAPQKPVDRLTVKLPKHDPRQMELTLPTKG